LKTINLQNEANNHRIDKGLQNGIGPPTTSDEQDTHRQSTGRAEGCGDSLVRGKLRQAEGPSFWFQNTEIFPAFFPVRGKTKATIRTFRLADSQRGERGLV